MSVEVHVFQTSLAILHTSQLFCSILLHRSNRLCTYFNIISYKYRF